MKPLLSFLFLASFIFHSCNNTPKQENPTSNIQNSQLDFSKDEAQLVKLYNQVLHYSENYSDSLEIVSVAFEKALTDFIQKNQSTIDYDFKMLVDSHVCYINTAKDGNLRIYSWDDGTGGSMRYFKNIYQWRNNGTVMTKVPQYEEGDAGSFCTQIFSVLKGQEPVYLVLNRSIYSNRMVAQSIQAFHIEPNQLNDSFPLFKSKTKMLSNIQVGYDFFSIEDENKQPSEMISYNYSSKTLFVTVTDKDGIVSSNRLKYQWMDTCFTFVGTEAWKGK